MLFATANWYDLVLNNEILFCTTCGMRYSHTEEKGKYILRFVDRASLYNLVNKVTLVHNFRSIFIFFCICFGRLCAHHQEI
jgi:hypothetical protein